MLKRSIYFFISVVENGSFSAAAKKYFLSQSAISQQISQLEAEMGVQLFDRSSYRPVLTEAGKYFYDQCKELSLKMEEVVKQTKKMSVDTKRELRVGITGPFENKHLPAMVAQYKAKYPDVEIIIKKGSFASNTQDIDQDVLDIAFGIENDFEHDENITIVPLFQHRVCVVCSPEHPWAKLKQIDIKDIGNEPIISFSKRIGIHFYEDFMEHFRLDGLKPNIVKEVEQLDELFFSIKLNEGVGFLAKEVVTEEGLVAIPLIHTHHHSTYCVAYNTRNCKDYALEFVMESNRYFAKVMKTL